MFPQSSRRFKPTEPAADFEDTKNSNPDYIYWKSLKEPSIVNQIGAVVDVAFQPCAPFNYAVTASTRIKIYDSVSGDEVRCISRFEDKAYSARYRADGNLLVAGCEDKHVRLFETSHRKPIKIYKGHQGPVRVTDFCKDSRHVFSGSDDGSVRVWEIESEACMNKFNFHQDKVRCGTMDPSKGTSVITGSYDHTVRIFDTRSNTNTITLNHGDRVHSVVAFPSKSIIVSAGGTSIKVWDMLMGKQMISLSNHHKDITCMCLNHDSTRLLSGSLDSHVKIYDIADYTVIHDIKYPAPVLSIGVSPDEDQLLVAGMTNSTMSVRERKAVRADHFHEDYVKQVKDNRRRQALFMKGQDFVASPDDVVIQHSEREELEKYDQYLKKFQHSKALDNALGAFVRSKKPQITVAVLEELIRREVLATSLAGRKDQKIIELLKFLAKNITNPTFEKTLNQVFVTLTDVYGPLSGDLSTPVLRHFNQVKTLLKRDAKYKRDLKQSFGYVELITTLQNPSKTSSAAAVTS